MDISVVVVTFDSVDVISECLDRLTTALNGYRSQVFVIDNRSSDGTRDLLIKREAELGSRFDHFELILNGKNTGFTRAVNTGLKRCRGRYILILNPDVFLRHNTISELCEGLEGLDGHGDTGVVVPQLRFADNRIQPSCRTFPRKRDILFQGLGLGRLFPKSAVFNRWLMPDFDFRHSRNVEQPQGAFLLFRREVLEQVGLLDERFFMFFSDVDWCYRICSRGWSIRFCAEVPVVHLKGDSVMPRKAAMIVSSHRSCVQYFAKYDRTPSQRAGTAAISVLLLLITLPRIALAQLPALRRP